MTSPVNTTSPELVQVALSHHQHPEAKLLSHARQEVWSRSSQRLLAV